MRCVIVESPYGTKDIIARHLNELYARQCLHDCLMRDELPFASHLLYTQPGVLDDNVPEERRRGIEAGLAWAARADAAVVYTDRGITAGMKLGIARHEKNGIPIEYRQFAKEGADEFRDTPPVDPGRGTGEGRDPEPAAQPASTE